MRPAVRASGVGALTARRCRQKVAATRSVTAARRAGATQRRNAAPPPAQWLEVPRLSPLASVARTQPTPITGQPVKLGTSALHTPKGKEREGRVPLPIRQARCLPLHS